MTVRPKAAYSDVSWREFQDTPQVEAKPKVVLYDAKGQPLTRPFGFTAPEPAARDHA